MSIRTRRVRGFSLIELVIVVVIIAIIAAIAVPKMSRGAAGANDSALMQNLSQMRSAIDLFATEHGGVYPSNTSSTTFTNQLTQYTDIGGTASATKSATAIYGPYLKAIPPLPVGTNKGDKTVSVTAPQGSGASGWYYDGTTVWANLGNTLTADKDAAGTWYQTY